MKFIHRFQVRADVSAVAVFHSQSSVLRAITPPPVLMRLHAAPPVLGEGDEMAFTMWLGPLPIHWTARIEQVNPAGFVDRQISGPFLSWVHTHTYVPLADGRTEVRDEIEAAFGGGLYRRLLAALMWFGLPVLFAYRGWKTRRLLEA